MGSTLIGIEFDLDDQVSPWGDTISWEERLFAHRPVANCFTNLRWIEQITLLKENALLNELINHFDLSQESQWDEIEAQRDEIEAQRDLVQEQKELIEHTHHDITSSIDYAMRLQDAPDLMPISHYEEMSPFHTTEVQLEAGDQLYLFSDGYANQFGGEKRKKFKYKAFRQLITEYADLSMPRQQQVLSDTIREWQGKNEQTDDMVIVGIRI